MKFKAIIKQRFRKPKTIFIFAEDMYWGLCNVQRQYPKHKVIEINYA